MDEDPVLRRVVPRAHERRDRELPRALKRARRQAVHAALFGHVQVRPRLVPLVLVRTRAVRLEHRQPADRVLELRGVRQRGGVLGV